MMSDVVWLQDRTGCWLRPTMLCSFWTGRWRNELLRAGSIKYDCAERSPISNTSIDQQGYLRAIT